MSTESSEHTSSDGPVLEEFIPINRASVDSHFENEEDELLQPEKNEGGRSDWLKTAQLWNQSPESPITEVEFHHHYSVSKNRERARTFWESFVKFVPFLQDVVKETASSAVEVKNNGGGGGGAFQPFQKGKTTPLKLEAAVDVAKTVGPSPIREATTSSTAETSKREEKESQTRRKQRRCWSSELHRRFVHALQQLGGPHGTNKFVFLFFFLCSLRRDLFLRDFNYSCYAETNQRVNEG